MVLIFYKHINNIIKLHLKSKYYNTYIVFLIWLFVDRTALLAAGQKEKELPSRRLLHK